MSYVHCHFTAVYNALQCISLAMSAWFSSLISYMEGILSRLFVVIYNSTFHCGSWRALHHHTSCWLHHMILCFQFCIESILCLWCRCHFTKDVACLIVELPIHNWYILAMCNNMLQLCASSDICIGNTPRCISYDYHVTVMWLPCVTLIALLTHNCYK